MRCQSLTMKVIRQASDLLTITEIGILQYYLAENNYISISSELDVSVNEVDVLLCRLKHKWKVKGEIGLTIEIIRQGYADISHTHDMQFANLAQWMNKTEMSVGLRNSLKKILSIKESSTFLVGYMHQNMFIQTQGAGKKKWEEFDRLRKSYRLQTHKRATLRMLLVIFTKFVIFISV